MNDRWTSAKICKRILEVLASYPNPISGSTIHNHMPSCERRIMSSRLNKMSSDGEITITAAGQYLVNRSRDNNLVIRNLWITGEPSPWNEEIILE